MTALNQQSYSVGLTSGLIALALGLLLHSYRAASVTCRRVEAVEEVAFTAASLTLGQDQVDTEVCCRRVIGVGG